MRRGRSGSTSSTTSIESLRTFDPDTQRTIEKVDAFEVLPAKEFPLNEASIANFRRRWHETFDVDVRRCPVYQDESRGLASSGIEFYLPFFFERLSTERVLPRLEKLSRR